MVLVINTCQTSPVQYTIGTIGCDIRQASSTVPFVF